MAIQESVQTIAIEQQPTPRSWWSIVWHQLRRNTGANIGGVVLGLLIVISVFAPVFAPYDPIEMAGDIPLEPPSLDHPMGTDPLGRDILSRVIFGGRVSLRLGVISVGIATAIGGVLGLLSGYYGGWLDDAIMRFVDILLAFPGILLALIIIYGIGPGLSNAMIAVGISAVPTYARLVRGSTLSAREETYVDAARVIGCRDLRIMIQHILPNVIGPVVVLGTLSLASAIMSIAALSFLGLGAEPPTPEWGVMLSEGRDYLRNAWWLSVFPGLAISIAVLAVNLFGDGLRDALDPKLRTS
jgi:peptide/nickel transport system permease protein